MKYFVYAMNGKAPAPASGGSTESWFLHYKWDVGGESFVPVALVEGAALPEKGDVICFVLDKGLIGFTRVTDIRRDDLAAPLEVCYDTRDITACPPGNLTWQLPLPTGVAVGEDAKFIEGMLKNFAATYPKRIKAEPPPAPETQPGGPEVAFPVAGQHTVERKSDKGAAD